MSFQIDPKVFRDLSYGLYIVTSIQSGRPNGQVVNTAIQVTSDPSRVAVIINKKNLTHEYITSSQLFGISVLDDTVTMKFIGPFGFRSGREVDKFTGVACKTAVTGCPLVTDHTLSVLEAEAIDSMDLGTHTIFIGNVVYSESLKDGQPLTYHFYHQVLKGKPSPNAPTFAPAGK